METTWHWMHRDGERRAKLLDHLWYVDAPDALRQERLVARQISGGRSEQAAWAWVERNDRPNGELVKASKANCDQTVTPVRV